MLRIGLDFINLRTLQDGMGRFTKEFLKGLARLGTENEYFLFFYHNILDEIKIDSHHFNKIPVKIFLDNYLPKNQIYLSLMKKKLPKIDFIHSPVSLPPAFFFKKNKVIATIHDLAFKFFPETCSKKSLLWWNISWPRCLKRTDHIVAISQNTKKDLIEIYKIPDEKISVIYNSISTDFPEFSMDSLVSIKSKYELPEKFILYVGAPHKRKNIINIVRAFKLIVEKNQFPYYLVLVGPKGWELNSLLKEIEGMNLQKRIVLTGFVSDEDLSIIYRLADVFVFPSLYEGFGYPPLEAMSCGTPVITSNTSSLKEVVGDGGLLVDPLDYKAMADAIVKVVSSPDLSKELIEKGFDQMKKFSLEKKIKSYLDLYKKVASI